jgi:hypothetical protein
MAKAKKQSSTSKVIKPAQQPAAPRRAYLEVTHVGQSDEDLSQLLERLWQQFQAGDDQALLDLIVWSLDAGRMPPRGARDEFGARYDRWRSNKIRTLDQTFRVERRKGKHVGHILSDEDLCRYIAVRMVELKHEQPKPPVDRHLYERLGRELGVGRTTVERIININKTPQYDTWRKLAEAGVLRLSPAAKS